MDPHHFLETLALVLGVAAITTVVSRRLRLPGVFGYLLAGMIVGPNVPLPVAADPQMVRAMSELGVILLMYSLGLEFRLRRVLQIGGTSGLAALAETGLMFGVGYSLAAAFGWTSAERLFTGAIVAISSTTIIARTFAEQGIHGRLKVTVFGILIVEDLIAILLLAILSTVAAGHGLSGRELAVTGVRLATFLFSLIAAGFWTLPRFMRFVLRLESDETTLVAAIGIAFSAALLAWVFGYSVALGAFIAGSLVAESGQGEKIDHLIAPVRDLFVAVFFVAVGMLIDPRVVIEQWPAVLALTALVVVGKTIAVSLGVFLTGKSLLLSVQAGMSLAQIGEFSFIIAGVGLAGGATRPFLYPVAIAVSAITTFTTPFLVRRAGAVAHLVDRKLPRPLQTFVALYGTWVAALGRPGPQSGAGSIRRTVRLLLADVALLAGLIVAAAAEMGRLAVLIEGWLGWRAPAGRRAVIALALLAAVPFAAGVVRMTRQLAVTLSLRSMPGPSGRGLDRAAAPRGAFVATLQYAMLLACAIPLVAVLLPLVPDVPVVAVLGALAVAAALAVWRSARTLYGHARAGAEVIIMALTQHGRARGSAAELMQTMDHVAAMLPGLGDPEPIRLASGDAGVGRTLRELDLRGTTGATVLAIMRGDGTGVESIAPAGDERLREGDILALAGTLESVDAARAMLQTPPAGPDRSSETS